MEERGRTLLFSKSEFELKVVMMRDHTYAFVHVVYRVTFNG
jgi:hypothetical protein